MQNTKSRYTVRNIVAMVACMLFAVALALYAFLDKPSRGNPVAMGLLFTGFALFLGGLAVNAVRSRRR